MPELQPVTDWPKCPACGSERWHHFGAFESVPTGRLVDMAVLDALPVARVFEDVGRDTSIALPWHETTGSTDAIRTEQP
jgi:hypothetical protein